MLENALAGWIEDGELPRHLKKSVKIYRQRRDYFCTLLQNQLGQWVQFVQPAGGMAVWTVFSSTIDLLALDTYVRTQGISLEGVAHWQPYHAIRLGFASLNEEEMVRGVAVVREGIERQMNS